MTRLSLGAAINLRDGAIDLAFATLSTEGASFQGGHFTSDVADLLVSLRLDDRLDLDGDAKW